MIAANLQTRLVRGLWALSTAFGFALAAGCDPAPDPDKTPAPTAEQTKAQQKIGEFMKSKVKTRGPSKSDTGN